MRVVSAIALGFLLAGSASADAEIRTIERQFEVGPEHEILLDVPIGTLRIEAGESGNASL